MNLGSDAVPRMELYFSDLSMELQAVLAAIQDRAKGQPNGKKIEFTGTTTVQMQDGKIPARWASLDLLRLMQQLGIVPPLSGS